MNQNLKHIVFYAHLKIYYPIKNKTFLTLTADTIRYKN